MVRKSIAVSLGVLIWGLAFALPAQASDFAQTCTYFRNVAFNDIHTGKDESFKARLAIDCDGARATLKKSRPGAASFEQAEDYLVALHRYRRALLDIGSARYRHGHIKRFSGADGLSGRSIGGQVSETGAYLIAHSLGLLGAQQRWHEWLEARVD